MLAISAVLLYAASASALFSDTAQAGDSLQESVQDAFIVKLRTGTQSNVFLSAIRSLLGRVLDVQHTYDHNIFQGFAGKLTAEEVKRLRQDSRVESVEPQVIMHIANEQASPPSWGLTRVSQRSLDLTKPYVYPDTAGEGIDIWVIDTGIQANHTDFGGRATFAKSFVTSEADADLHGHGTHVAGTIASKTYGVAKKARVFGIKVMDARGSGSDANVIAGIQYAVKNGRPGKTVINMSLGGRKSSAVDSAVAAAANAGIAVIVAAGNEKKDACNGSPSGSDKVLTVAASDRTDAQASFSNYGKCVDLYAPGVSITSLWKGGNGATKSISGTSMASPHVAGIAALYLASGLVNSVNELYNALVRNATPSAIKKPSANTINRLAYSSPSNGVQPGPFPNPPPEPAPSPSPFPFTLPFNLSKLPFPIKPPNLGSGSILPLPFSRNSNGNA
ncbi:peptidase S8/S53 domain-containing protein [Thamnocephalis sphaerospora]|uniref:Peptidase S8/S53 domain-containing protein n=1 Tax=Thamnocephalis sphaerospora TaxID=78915 RepID=A0A4P9XLA5_9FUNG|nr:peptidase S8/S53 domain-containing protein [Thamnocephalis sphaerospora]|eukprot:RKP06585.1 peptidase S8/S53 domain-containing protein [Thamnocephalis sphaerospora]